MHTPAQEARRCEVCHRPSSRGSLVPAAALRPAITELICREVPAWSPHSYICRDDLARYRNEHIAGLLRDEKGELSALDRDVLESLRQHELLSASLEDEPQRQWPLKDRLADKLAGFGGSWRFLIGFALFLGGWIVLNALVLRAHPPDPYPFILLNLILSTVAAVQAPIIMMSQNRQEAKDRQRAQYDYRVNLKAELEIRQLHEKVDHLLSHQWERLVEIQQVQLELLAELNRRGR